MSVIIKAIFDSPDTADNALAELRRSNLNIQAYKSTPIERQDNDENHGMAIPAMATNSVFLGATATTMSVAPVGAVFTNAVDDDRRVLKDTRSTEVIVNMTVDDAQSEAVQAALVSLGGRQVGVI